ncbi:MAG: hypothetical protein RKP20_09825 [Candidatus Competibacter sp.]|nr:hypothetical protein [Candidatus Competibacter sp.]MDS4075200.1 hypothetical protein [Accumulibacter sp.]
MNTPIATSALVALISLYGITPAMAESFNNRKPDIEDRTSARQAPMAYPREGRLAGLPAAQSQNGITFVTGGIGKPEANAMKAAAKRYDLMLVFADREGHYLADVNVKIKDTKGNTVLDIVSDPILLADLPAGRYIVRAEVDGKSLAKTLNLTGKTSRRPAEIVYHWPHDFSEKV